LLSPEAGHLHRTNIRSSVAAVRAEHGWNCGLAGFATGRTAVIGEV
jgi:hypothetical protein